MAHAMNAQQVSEVWCCTNLCYHDDTIHTDPG